MTSIKVKFHPSSLPGKPGSVVYSIIHSRVCRCIPSGIRVFPGEWDSVNCRVILSGVSSQRCLELAKANERIALDCSRLHEIVTVLEAKKEEYTVSKIVELFRQPTSGFLDYAVELVARLKLTGKLSTARNYGFAINKFAKFLKNDNLSALVITSDVAMRFETALRNDGLCDNTISYYMRNLRAIYNRGVEEDVLPQTHPWRRVYTGIAKTRKRALPIDEIRAISALDLSKNPSLDFARDMFMMSFFLRGMSVIDMAYLRTGDLRDGVVTYRRQKTGQTLRIKWEKPMQDIIDKYPASADGYLLPVIKDGIEDVRLAYRSRAHFINEKLKTVGKLAGCSIPLTLYVARHCWASAARSCNIPLSVISEGMGHDSEKTTQIYLASIDSSTIDNANTMLLKALSEV